jgi:hypothetical protein
MRELRMVSEDGQSTVTLTPTSLVFTGPKGQRTVLGAALMGLYDGQNKLRLGLSVPVDGPPAVELYDQNEVKRIALMITQGNPALGLLDERREPRVMLAVGNGNSPFLALGKPGRPAKVIAP